MSVTETTIPALSYHFSLSIFNEIGKNFTFVTHNGSNRNFHVKWITRFSASLSLRPSNTDLGF